MSIISKQKVSVIAEAGINFNQSLTKAKDMIKISAESGADFCKFQLFNPKLMFSPKAGNYTNSAGTFDIYKVVKDNTLPKEWVPFLKKECDKHGIHFMCSVCDFESLNFLMKYDPKIIKIPSSEISFLPLLKRVGIYNLPTIFSTAGATLGDIEEALSCLGKLFPVCLMHCNGRYPTLPNQVNMKVLKTFALAFPDLIIGFSDHTEDPIEAPVAAICNGATVIEKHFTLDKKLPGPDHSFAVEPEGLFNLVKAVREADQKLKNSENIAVNQDLIGKSSKDVNLNEEYLRNFAHRSIFSARQILKGKPIKEKDLVVLRNGQQEKGFHPREFDNLIGKKFSKDIAQGEPINWSTIM